MGDIFFFRALFELLKQRDVITSQECDKIVGSIRMGNNMNTTTEAIYEVIKDEEKRRVQAAEEMQEGTEGTVSGSGASSVLEVPPHRNNETIPGQQGNSGSSRKERDLHPAGGHPEKNSVSGKGNR